MGEKQGALLSIRGLGLSFADEEHPGRYTEVLRDLDLTLHSGALVAVVGASGSGKSLLAHAILGILPRHAALRGTMLYEGTPLDAALQKRLRGAEIVLVPQNISYLDPLMKVGAQVRGTQRDAGERVRVALGRYGLGTDVENRYPFELSGGMTRRVLISTAVVTGKARLIVADEPTPGLHLRIARRVLGHFRELADAGAGVLLITHDLELAAEVADRVVVLYAGRAVEEARAADFAQLETLRHPYTRALWQAMPAHGFVPLAGTQPHADALPAGCAFRPRCPHAHAACSQEIPWQTLAGGAVRCTLHAGEGEAHA